MYLSGVHNESVLGSAALESGSLGLLLTPNPKLALAHARLANAYPFCAFDNDCFANSAKFTLEGYADFLTAALEIVEVPALFATAPDVIGDFPATLERSAPALPVLRQLGLRAALVLQDGATADNIPWSDLDAVFIGGTDDFKLNYDLQRSLIAEAKRRDKWVHVGRVNGQFRFHAFASLGADSADGTHLRFEPSKNIRNIDRWITSWHAQGRLF